MDTKDENKNKAVVHIYIQIDYQKLEKYATVDSLKH